MKTLSLSIAALLALAGVTEACPTLQRQASYSYGSCQQQTLQYAPQPALAPQGECLAPPAQSYGYAQAPLLQQSYGYARTFGSYSAGYGVGYGTGFGRTLGFGYGGGFARGFGGFRGVAVRAPGVNVAVGGRFFRPLVRVRIR